MKKMKRVGLMMAAAFVFMPFPALLDAQASQVNHKLSSETVPAQTAVNRAGVAVNGTVVGAIDPIRIGDLYYVPFKSIARLLDYDDIRYNSQTKTYTATDGSVTVRVAIGASTARKGDETVTIEPAKFINGTTYLSLDAVSAVFNTFSYFKPENGSVQIQMPARQYRVQAGDTLWKIAQAHHTTIPAVKSVNALRSDNLNVGQMLKLPPEVSTKEMEPSSHPTQGDIYIDNGGYDDYGYDQPAPTQPKAQRPAPSQPQAEQPAPSANGGTTAATGSLAAKQQAVINTAKKYMGVPYKFGAKEADAPRLMDCSSYTQYVFKQNGISLPRDSRQQSSVGTSVTSMQVGDLMFFKYPERYSDGRVGHVGIYMGNGQMIHTVPKGGVKITNYQGSSYWKKNFLFAKRVIR